MTRKIFLRIVHFFMTSKKIEVQNSSLFLQAQKFTNFENETFCVLTTICILQACRIRRIFFAKFFSYMWKTDFWIIMQESKYFLYLKTVRHEAN